VLVALTKVRKKALASAAGHELNSQRSSFEQVPRPTRQLRRSRQLQGLALLMASPLSTAFCFGVLLGPSPQADYHITSRRIISLRIRSHIVYRAIISYHAISNHTVAYHIISYHVISYHTIPYHITSHHIASHRLISYRFVSCDVMLYHIMSY